MPMWRPVCILALALPSAVSAAEVPALTGPVNDYANVLSAKEREDLTAFLLAGEKATTNQVVVLTVTSLDGEPIEAFAQKVFRSWKLGRADRDNGVLVVLAVRDRAMRIEVGRGLEGALTDARCSQIIRNEAAPRLKDGKYGEGLTAAVTAIDQAVKGEYAAEDDGPGWGAVLVVLVLVILLFVVLGLLERRSPGTLKALSSAGAQWAAKGLPTGSRRVRRGKRGARQTQPGLGSDDPAPSGGSDTDGSAGGCDFGGGGTGGGSDGGYSGGGGDSGGGGASGRW